MAVVTRTRFVLGPAIFHSRSDTNLFTDRFTQKQQLPKTAASVSVSTAGGTHVVATDRAEFQLVSVGDNEQIDAADANTLADLPMHASKSVDAILCIGCYCQA